MAPSGPYLGSNMKSTAVRTFLAAASLRLLCLTVSFRSCLNASDDWKPPTLPGLQRHYGDVEILDENVALTSLAKGRVTLGPRDAAGTTLDQGMVEFLESLLAIRGGVVVDVGPCA